MEGKNTRKNANEHKKQENANSMENPSGAPRVNTQATSRIYTFLSSEESAPPEENSSLCSCILMCINSSDRS